VTHQAFVRGGAGDSACGKNAEACTDCESANLSCSPTVKACEPRKLRVFTSSATFNGDLRTANGEGDLYDWNAEPDRLCTKAAHAAQRSGEWQAFLPYGTTVTAQDRLTAQGPWYLMGTDTVVFADKESLTGNPTVALTRDELGNLIAETPVPVWTSLSSSGEYAYTSCSGWTQGRPQYFATQGDAAEVTSWKWYRETTCEQQARLYCFQE